MNCKKCGFPLSENDQFCKNCGATVNAQDEQDNVEQADSNIQSNTTTQDTTNSNTMNVTQNDSAPVNNVQQPAANGNNNVKYIVIGIVAVIVILAGVYLFTSKSGNGSGSGNGGPVATTVSSKAYKVDFNGFTFSIPDEYIYQLDGTRLLVGDDADSWAIAIEVGEGSYAKLSSKKGQLKSTFEANYPGITCSDAKVANYGGSEFITLELAQSGQNYIIAFTKINSMYFAAVTAYTLNNDYDTSLLDRVAPIISSATPVEEAKSISAKQSFDFSKFNELAK